MKDEADLRRSMRAQWNTMRRSAIVLLDILNREDPDTIRGVHIGDIRDEVEAITKAGHEFSAYHNVWTGPSAIADAMLAARKGGPDAK